MANNINLADIEWDKPIATPSRSVNLADIEWDTTTPSSIPSEPAMRAGLTPFEKQLGDISSIALGTYGAGKGILETAKNIPSSTLEVVKGIGTAITSPIQTAKGVGSLVKEMPSAITGGEAPQWLALGNLFKERYGSIEDLNKTIIQDPAGFAMDLSTVLGGAGAAVKGVGTVGKLGQVAEVGKAISKTGKVFDPIARAATGVSTVAAARTPVHSLIKSSLELPTKKGIYRTDTLAQAFFDKNLTVSRESLRALDNDIRKVQKSIADIIEEKTKEGARIRTTRIVQSLDDLIHNAGKHGLEKPDLDVLGRMRDQFSEQHGAILTPKQIQDIKMGFNERFKPNTEGRFEAVRTQVRDKLRDATKTTLEEIHPGLKNLNADEGVMIELKNAIERRIVSLEKQPTIPVKGLVAGGIAGGVAGATTGSLAAGLKFGAAAIAAEKIMESPRVQIALAHALHRARLAAIKSKKLGAITRPAFQVGREGSILDPNVEAYKRDVERKGLYSK